MSPSWRPGSGPSDLSRALAGLSMKIPSQGEARAGVRREKDGGKTEECESWGGSRPWAPESITNCGVPIMGRSLLVPGNPGPTSLPKA